MQSNGHFLNKGTDLFSHLFIYKLNAFEMLRVLLLPFVSYLWQTDRHLFNCWRYRSV